MTLTKVRNTPGRGENLRGGEVLLRAVYGTFEYCGNDAVFEKGNILDCYRLRGVCERKDRKFRVLHIDV